MWVMMIGMRATCTLHSERASQVRDLGPSAAVEDETRDKHLGSSILESIVLDVSDDLSLILPWTSSSSKRNSFVNFAYGTPTREVMLQLHPWGGLWLGRI